ncbi:MAG: hypothetical protein O9308_04495 [Beijerinckiaceae bacterium]|nr:hypothetical protein [Beijerinckiaceae bacterium]
MEVPYESHPHCVGDWQRWYAFLCRLDQARIDAQALDYDGAYNAMLMTPEDRAMYLEFMENPPRFQEIAGESFRVPAWLHFIQQEIVGSPVLVLASKSSPPSLHQLEWVRIKIQIDGNACNELEIFAVNLPIQKCVFEKFIALERNFYQSNIGWDQNDISDFEFYRESLRQILPSGVTCNKVGHWLREAFYPIDFTREGIAALVDEKSEIFDVLEFAALDQDAYFLAILTANCD